MPSDSISRSSNQVLHQIPFKATSEPCTARKVKRRSRLSQTGKSDSLTYYLCCETGTSTFSDGAIWFVNTTNRKCIDSTQEQLFSKTWKKGYRSDSTSPQRPEQHLSCGKTLVVIQHKKKNGKIQLKVSSNRFKDAILELNRERK